MLLALTCLLLAQAVPPAPSPVPSPSPAPPAKAKPAAKASRRARTVCSTRVLNVDPTADPGMVMSVDTPLDSKIAARGTCKPATPDKDKK